MAQPIRVTAVDTFPGMTTYGKADHMEGRTFSGLTTGADACRFL